MFWKTKRHITITQIMSFFVYFIFFPSMFQTERKGENYWQPLISTKDIPVWISWRRRKKRYPTSTFKEVAGKPLFANSFGPSGNFRPADLKGGFEDSSPFLKQKKLPIVNGFQIKSHGFWKGHYTAPFRNPKCDLMKSWTPFRNRPIFLFYFC